MLEYDATACAQNQMLLSLIDFLFHANLNQKYLKSKDWQ